MGIEAAWKCWVNQWSVKVEVGRYPFSAIGIQPTLGMVIRGDAGFISSDSGGTIDAARTYWSNEVTNLTNDMPLEAWLYPATWGEFKFE